MLLVYMIHVWSSGQGDENFTFKSNSSTNLIRNEELKCEKWVIVNYEGKFYPGEITKRAKNGTFFVNVMEE